MIRARTPKDLPDLLRALREVHEHDAYPSVWPAEPLTFIDPPDTLVGWVAVQDERAAGQILLRRATPNPSWMQEAGLVGEAHAIISRLFIAPHARKSGLAEALFNAAWTEAQAQGLRPVLDVHHKNHAAIRLYERLGWQRLATVKANWTDPDGTLPDVHVYLAPEL